MSEGNSLMLFSLTIYKVITIFAGLAFAFMGYKLFIHGIFMEAGELHTNWENRSLVLRKAAPGTFFALFGTLVVCTSLWRGLTFKPSQGTGYDYSGIFGNDTSKGDNRKLQSPTAEQTRQSVLNDIATFNQFANDLLRQRKQGEDSRLTVTVGDGDRILDLIDRTKATLMLSVWSQDWGDPEEFRKWAYHAPGYAYGDPPTSIARAVAIFKGEAQ
jgi:hypothetical protein